MKKIYVYWHTHWDREWYQPFESFRARLLPVVERVLNLLDSGNLPNFYLDGQSAVLEDVVELAPELALPLRKAMQSGKLSAGPWYVLADQMLVSGESLIRNLKVGREACATFGIPSPIGYCPDTFGHSQDLPRILAGFGIEKALVWRGVPPVPGGPLFWWQAPDGSRVLTYHLTRGYYQTAFHEQRSADELAKSLFDWLWDGEALTFCRQVNGALYPSGGDHLPPPPAVTKTIAALGESLSKKDDLEIEAIPLPTFLELLKPSEMLDLPVLTGELRDNRNAKAHERAYLLPGVLSTRLHLKRDNRLAEHRLVSIIEPLLTLLHLKRASEFPQREMDHAWRLLLANHAHDSICGCSIDEVHRDMKARSAQLHALLDALEDSARESAAVLDRQADISKISARDPEFEPNRIIFHNLSGQELGGPVRLTICSEVFAPPMVSTGDFQLIGQDERNELFSSENLLTYYKPVVLSDVWVWSGTVPAFGLKESSWPLPSGLNVVTDPVVVSGKSMSNGLLKVQVQRDRLLSAVRLGDGQAHEFKIGHIICDRADGGDSYNFDPIVSEEPIVAKLKSVQTGQMGPLVGSLLLTYDIAIPEKMIEPSEQVWPQSWGLRKRSARLLKHRLVTEVMLKRGIPILFFQTRWQNASADHRLEVVFDTSQPIVSSFSENHFSLVKRAHPVEQSVLPVEEGTEAINDRFPAQRFVIANQQVFFNTGLPEYGVTESHLSMTLLRAISYLSRDRLGTRGGGAGPNLATPEANCLGPLIATYGWAPLTAVDSAGSSGSPAEVLSRRQIIEAYELAEQFEGRLWACLGKRENKERAFSLVRIDNPAIRLTALYRGSNPEHVLVRLLNVVNDKEEARLLVDFPCRSLAVCDLEGRVKQELFSMDPAVSGQPGAILTPLTFGPNELVTIRCELLPNR